MRERLQKRTLDEIFRHVVQITHLQKIILFDSAACGELGQNSDIDLFVVMSNAYRRRIAMEVYRQLIGVARAVDVVMGTPGDIVRSHYSHSLIILPALEGKIIYAT